MSQYQNLQGLEWPYPVAYGKENEIESDVLVLGAGLAGLFAAISAAKKGLKVALVDKSNIIRSGSAGSGIDHWHGAATNPNSTMSPDELTQATIERQHGWASGIHIYIGCQESWPALLDLEKMGMKIRDTEDEFKGAPFRDEKTKLLYAYDYTTNECIRVWATGMKPALLAECERLGIQIYKRIMATGLLTEGGKQGGRVVGATGVNTRTGEFYIFKAKATVLSAASVGRLWIFSTEFIGLSGSQFTPGVNSGDGHAMGWRAGAEFSGMEHTMKMGAGGGFAYPPYGVGNPRNTWYACTMVDANGKEISWVNRDGDILKTVDERYRPAPGQKFRFQSGGGFGSLRYPGAYEYRGHDLIKDVYERVKKGELTPPFYADLPSMPEHERRAIFGLMVGQEGKTKIPVYYTLTQAGFDPEKDMLQYYEGSWEGVGPPQWRSLGAFYAGGLIPDWDLRTNLEGLYAAGDQLLTTIGAAHACATGRYAGRTAAKYAREASEPVIDRSQVDKEKQRVYAPVKRKDGIDWKELNAGIARVMQDYCGETRNEPTLNIGLKWLDEIKEAEAAQLYARNPHELTRALEVLNILTLGEMVIHASLARKASHSLLGFKRSDYPEDDPPEWRKWITTRLVDDKVQVSELPLDFWGPLKENYDAHCEL